MNRHLISMCTHNTEFTFNCNGRDEDSCLPVPVPGQPTVFVTAITVTSISLSWSVPSGSVVISSEVMWRVFSSGGGSGSSADDEGSGTSGNITSTSYTIQELESGTNYSITVTVANAAGSTVSHPILITTSEEDS